MSPAPFGLAFAFAPFRLSGAVYGVAVGHAAWLDALGDAVHAPPYKAPPSSVVLYVKPRNTFIGPGDEVEAPADDQPLTAGATLGVVIARTACRVAERDALGCVAGYLVAADFSLPSEQHYRPQVRGKARDRSLVVSVPVAAADVGDADSLAIRVGVDGRVVHETSTGDTIRSIARLVADVSDFVTLSPGDLLLTGVAPGAPNVGAGAAVSVEIDRVGAVHARIAATTAAIAGVRETAR